VTGPPFPKVDLTDAVTAAAATGQAVVVTLRAAAPAALSLSAVAHCLQRYPVVFPEGAVRSVDAPTEGVYPLSLPVQPGTIDPAHPWVVQQVVLDVSAKLPTTRVLPADGPAFSAEAVLVLDPDHSIVVQLPRSATAALAKVTGIRLPVVVGADGAELAGTLRAGTADRPGDPIPKGALGPVTLEPGKDDPVWIDLPLTTQHTIASGDVLWVEVQAARGSVKWKLATPPADANDTAQLRRRTSSGTYVELSSLSDVHFTGALRVVGQEKPNDPLAAVLVAVHGAGASGTVAGVPTQAGTTLILTLNPPVTFPATPESADTDFALDLTISAPGSYAITAAELQYTTSGGST
jgi:hypothetical protein